MQAERLSASFRDPSGFLYKQDGVLLRQVNPVYQKHYEMLCQSGLYDRLVEKNLLIEHCEHNGPGLTGDAFRVLQPKLIPYISYPYEWSFSQLKSAALLTLRIQKEALDHGMGLKDASAFNIQFLGHRPVFIDSLSFEIYEEGQPWVAYRQFCQHFLGPLALMAEADMSLQHLLRAYLDGIPLDVTSQLLPTRTKLRYSLLTHIHLHARSQLKYQNIAATSEQSFSPPLISKRLLAALIESLRSAVKRLQLPRVKTEWGDYYSDTNYSDESMAAKETLVAELLGRYAVKSTIIHDLGANTGRFSELAVRYSDYVVAHDVDQLAVERHYLRTQETGQAKILPLLLDLTNPTSSLGWNLTERLSFAERAQGGVVMALALIHHLAISNNVPLEEISSFFSSTTEKLLIEFVPKPDSQVRRLLATREDIFPSYTIEGFEAAFKTDFKILSKEHIPGTERSLYFMERQSG